EYQKNSCFSVGRTRLAILWPRRGILAITGCDFYFTTNPAERGPVQGRDDVPRALREFQAIGRDILAPLALRVQRVLTPEVAGQRWHARVVAYRAGDAGLQRGMEIAKVCNLSQNPPFFAIDKTLLLKYYLELNSKGVRLHEMEQVVCACRLPQDRRK